MKSQARGASLLGCLLLATLWLGCGGTSQREVSLLSEIAYARVGPVVSGTGTLGSCTYRPFLGKGMRPDKNAEWVAPFPGVNEAGFGLYLHDVVALEVVVEGRLRSPGPARPVTFLVGGQEVATEQVGPSSEGHRLRLEPSLLKVGMNWLTLRDCQGTEWLNMTVAIAGGAKSLSGGKAVAAQPDHDQDTLGLPFGGRIELALTPDQETELRFEAATWTEQGAPPLDQGSWKLEVSLASEASPYKVIAELDQPEEGQVALPKSQEPRALALKARFTGQGDPLPGQLGVKLSRPRFLGPLPAAIPTPTPALSPPSVPPQPPNVLIYLVDTLRADRLGCYGETKPTSPRLDQMAKESVVFEQALSTAPWTKPSVASLMTGTEPVTHRVLDFMDKLPLNLVTLAEVFQGGQYQTGAFVTNPLVGQQFNFDQGFTTFQDIPYQNATAQLVNSKVFPWLDGLVPGKPFFLYVHTLDPHIPYNPPQPFRRAWLRGWREPSKGNLSKAVLGSKNNPDFQALTDELKRRSFQTDPIPIPQATYDNINALYEGELASNDAAFGDLLDKLKAKGLYDNTVIVFVSDHGEELLDREKLGHLHKVHQELIRIPLLVKYPQGRNGGQRVSQACQVVDLMPTLLAETGLPRPVEASRWHLPLTGSEEVRPFFFDIEAGRQARLAKQPEGNYLIDATGVRVGHWTAAICRAGNFPTDPFCLFDLKSDPGEVKNLWLEHPVRALQLETLIRRYKGRRHPNTQADTASPEEAERILRSLQYLR